MSSISIGIGTKELTHDQITESGVPLLDPGLVCDIAVQEIPRLFGDPELFKAIQQEQLAIAFNTFVADNFSDGYDDREATYFAAAFEDAITSVIALYSIIKAVYYPAIDPETTPSYQLQRTIVVDYTPEDPPLIDNPSIQKMIDGMEDFMACINEPLQLDPCDHYDPFITYLSGFGSGCRFALEALAFRHEELVAQFETSEL